ncbi:LOW QUALITY PROTEIN: lysophospholipase-like protein 1 [Arabidopsis lyrata subsp. lyrata]|uniref:LOW QUALITY PROTEIN: lysophospholipase-like protein 1 n=1 Tax=Arabidopsis lyrata subsp. lyrata TaxID=81972 RepID=UPI000A29E2B0|nr:LOW QUALITY PROTEIN: lysophospholipase-like protein 1 [Arabidopsis lyrata subsp. lyrata]|eukprot:XP_020866077.1 LOW QUALITY PROTEIN: lysophospholipase-like protein 1 [Arabidopsis lyrata subsp. lyrata]
MGLLLSNNFVWLMTLFYGKIFAGSRNRGDVLDSVVQPKGEHRVTIVWLHDKDEHFTDSVQFVKKLNRKNVKWICPSLVFPDSWNKPGYKINQYVREALYPTAELVNKLSLEEPENVIKGVGGFGMGAAVALHFATSCALNHYPINPRVVVAISGWLAKAWSVKNSIEFYTLVAKSRAALQSIFLTHGIDDPVVPHSCSCGEEAAASLINAGFGEVRFLPLARFGPTAHEINRSEMVKSWLEEKLPLRDDVHPKQCLP